MSKSGKDLKVSPGDALSASKWNRIVDRLPGRLGGAGMSYPLLPQSVVVAENQTGAVVELGQVSYLKSWAGPTEPFDASLGAFGATNPTWHTEIAKLAVAAEPIQQNELGVYVVSGQAIVRVSGNNAGTHLMIDPTDTKQTTPTTGGFAQNLAAIDTGYCLANIGQPQNLWRYVLTQDSQAPGTTTATLRDMAGNQFAASINLSDPLGFMDDQVNGDAGFCINAGNDFYAIQAVCPPAGP